MNLKRKKTTLAILALFGLAMLLAACGQAPVAEPQTIDSQPADTPAQPPAATVTVTLPTPAVQEEAPPSGGVWPDGQPQAGNQGAVTFAVTPLNLNNPSGALEFEVTMDTHSVELDMDLAALATLSADNGLSAQATSWDAPRGGHHVSGILSFPAAVDGRPLLEGAGNLTLIIRDVDAAEQLFIWSIAG